MKKYFILLIAAIFLAACEKDFQPVAENVELKDVVQSNKVSLKEALLYAENSINGINPTTRSAERKVKSTEIYVAKPATRSAEGAEVSFYLINYENNEGFAMVSTDSRATPVYAYSDEGSLTAEDFETNPFLKIFIEGSIENYQIELASYDDRLPIELPDSIYGDITRLPIVEYDGGYYYEGKSSETISKDELLTTEWHQHDVYGFNCDNGIAGCGPLAAAQIMAYHKHPEQHNGHIYNWDAMTATPTLNNQSPGWTYVAALIEDIGDEAGANYYDNGTGATSIGIKNAFRDFDYNCGHPASYNIDRIRENIDAEHPIFISGDNSEGDGHAWVIDGYHHTTYRTTYYYTYEPYARYDTFVSSTKTYFHCNLGSCYYLQDYEPNGYFYAYSLSYPNDIEVIYDIEPNL